MFSAPPSSLHPVAHFSEVLRARIQCSIAECYLSGSVGADAKSSHSRIQPCRTVERQYPVFQANRPDVAGSDSLNDAQFDERGFQVSCPDRERHACCRFVADVTADPSCTELFPQPLKNRPLFVLPCASDLRQEPQASRLFRGDVLRALIACGAKRAQIRQFIFSAKAFILDMPDMQTNLALCRRVNISRRQSAHLASESVAV